MKIGIVGAGIGGLASAVRLASKGHTVTVYEANSYPGGKLSEFDLGDYRFDAGPSLFTMAEYVEDLFKIAGKNIADYFSYKKLDTVCHYFWEDGTRFTAKADPMQFAEAAYQTFGVEKRQVLKAFEDAAHKYTVTAPVFLEQSLHKVGNFLNLKTLRGVLNIPRLDIFKSMNAVNERLKHPKLVQLFNRYATYNGSNPYQASGIMTSIPHLEHGIGTYFPEGGMYSITKAIYNLAKDLGVVFHFDTKVEEILINNRKASGLRINSDIVNFDAVVSNMDVFFAYRKLLPNEKQPTKILSQEKSSSALIFYWGIKQEFSALGLHNILFTENYKTEFDYIFNKKELYHDPTVYINITKKYCEADAPKGGENWFVMINVPHNAGQDWDKIIAEAKPIILNKISRNLGVAIEPLIEVEHLLEPRTIESRTQSHLGSLYGTSSNNRYSAFLRHPNFSSSIKNLYFCGGSVHPGGGIPLCLLSAKIVGDCF